MYSTTLYMYVVYTVHSMADFSLACSLLFSTVRVEVLRCTCRVYIVRRTYGSRPKVFFSRQLRLRVREEKGEDGITSADTVAPSVGRSNTSYFSPRRHEPTVAPVCTAPCSVAKGKFCACLLFCGIWNFNTHNYPNYTLVG